MAQKIDIIINANSKGAVVGVNGVDGALKNFDKTTKKAGSSMKGMWKQMAGGMVASQLAMAGFNKLKQSISDAVTSTIDFETEFANVTTLLNDNAPVKKMRNDVLAMAGSLGSAEELTKGLYQALSAGQEPATAVQFVGEAAKFAKAGLVDMTASVDVLTTVLNAYGLEAKEVTDVSDVLFQVIKEGKTTGQELAVSLGQVIPTASTLGIDIRELGGAMATLTKFGISTSEATTALNATMMAIIKPMDSAKKKAKELGINFSKAGIEGAGGLQKWLIQVKDKLKGNEKAMAELFPNVRALKATFTLAGKGAQEYTEQMEKMKNVTGNTAEAFEKQQQTFAFVWDGLKNKIEAVVIKTLLPMLGDLTDWINNNEEDLTEMFTNAVEGIGFFLKSMGYVINKLSDMNDVLKFSVGYWVQLFTNSNEEIKILRAQAKDIKLQTDARKIYSKVLEELSDRYMNITQSARDYGDSFQTMSDMINDNPFLSGASKLKLMNELFAKLKKGDFGVIMRDIAESTEKSTDATKDLITEQKIQNEVMRLKKEAYEKSNSVQALAKKRIDDEKKAIEEANKKREKHLKLLEDEKNVLRDMKVPQKDYTELLEKQAPQLKIVVDETNALDDIQTENLKTIQKAKDKYDDFKKTLDAVGSALFSGINILEEFGLISGDTAKTLSGLASAGMGVVDAFTDPTASLADKINAVANAVTQVGKVIIDWLTGDGVGEAIERENAWMKITEEQEEALRDLEEQIGTTHGATSVYLDTLMKGQVTLENSDKWLYRIRETLSDLDQGVLNSNEVVKEIGESFEVWLEQAKELGTTGSKEFFNFLGDLQNRGLEVAEITEFIAKSWDSAVDGWRKFKDETGSTLSIPILDDIIAKQDELAKDKYQPALNGLDGLEQALLNMSNAVILTENQFDQFEAGARSTFESLTKNGLDGKTALEQMAPMLSRLIFLSNEHGLVIDKETQAIIDQAREAGVNLDVQKSIGEQQLDLQKQQLELFEKIAVALGVDMPNAMDKFANSTTSAFGKAGREVEKFGKELNGLKTPNLGSMKFSGGEIPKFANGGSFTVPDIPQYQNDGFLARFDAGEKVVATPKGQTTNNSTSNENITNNINVVSNTGDDTIRQLIEGIKTNRYGIRQYLKKGVA